MPSCQGLLRACAAFAIVCLSVGCGSSEPSDPKEDAGSNDPDAAGPAVDASDPIPVDDSGVPNGDGGLTDSGIGNVTPTLASAQVRQTGRAGADLRIDVTGSDADGNTVAVRVELFGAASEPLPIVDKNNDGQRDPGPVDLPLAVPLPASANATGYTTLAGYYAATPGVVRATVALVDARGNVSNGLQIDVATQPVVAVDGICDPAYLASRCQPSFGCKGMLPAVCKPGDGPTITKGGYYSDELGDRILIEGTDPDEDVVSYTVSFLNPAGSPIGYDITGPDDNNDPGETGKVPSFTNMETVTFVGGKFLIRFEPGKDFLDDVKRVKLVVTDSGGRVSAPVTTPAWTGAPVKQPSQVCDTRGFDRCATNSVCTRATSTATEGVCKNVVEARTAACAASLILSPQSGITEVRGQVVAPSLWDVPGPGCSSGDPKYRPDALVKVILTRPVKTLELSTNNAVTLFDSTLYAFSACGATPQAAWCNDDQPGTGLGSQLAVLTLTDLTAGEYFVVVDSVYAGTGTSFQLTASVTE